MSRKKPEFTKKVTIRLKPEENNDLTNLCEAMGTTKSEFLRKQISNLNNAIMKNTNPLMNIQPAPERDAWGRTNENEMKEKADKTFKQQLKKEFPMSAGASDGETPYSTPEGILVQMKNLAKEKSYYLVKGRSGTLKIAFSNYVEADTPEKAIEAIKIFHHKPGAYVSVTTCTKVEERLVPKSRILKA